ncbi:MAG: glycosyltransferase family 39 protein [Zavarzinella sp.]
MNNSVKQDVDEIATMDAPKKLWEWGPYFWQNVLFPCKNETQALSRVKLTSIVLLVILPGLLLYPTISYYLLEPDEGRYAQIPREMVLTGDWVVPHLQGEPYLDKPPLFYWLVAISYHIFGVSEAAARLIPAIAVHLTILCIYLIGRRSLGERAALWGALLLTVIPGFTGVARLLVLDGLLTFFVTLGLLSIYESIRTPQFRRFWWYLGATAVGAGILTKGPIPLLLILPVVIAYRWISGNATSIPRKHLLGAAAILCIINFPWYFAIYLREPVFLRYFFWEHNILRFIKPFDHLEPVWFYLPIVVGSVATVVLFPLIYFRQWIFRAVDETPYRTKEHGFFLMAGLWCIFFFSMSGCKLPTYILPAFPPLMLALGHFLVLSGRHRTKLVQGGTTFAWIFLAFAIHVVVPWYAELRSPMGPQNVAQRLQRADDEKVYCFPRNVDSVAFYTGRNDLQSLRSKHSQKLVMAIENDGKALVLFTHSHSLETFKQVLPPHMKVTEAMPARHQGTGFRWLDGLIGETPWGLCDIAVVERIDNK